jgi:hypothetical protein
MKYAALVTHTEDNQERYDKFLEFHTQEDCKEWIRTYGDKKDYRLIEYQDIEVKKEVVITFKKPLAIRT